MERAGNFVLALLGASAAGAVAAALILLIAYHLDIKAGGTAAIGSFALNLAVLSLALLPSFLLTARRGRARAGPPAMLLALLLGTAPVPLIYVEIAKGYYPLDHDGADLPDTERFDALRLGLLTVETAAAAAGVTLAALLFWYRLAPGAWDRIAAPIPSEGKSDG